MAGITHHGIRHSLEDKSTEEWEETKTRLNRFADWLLLFLVAGLTLALVISFAIL